jgi:sulfate adenylyltransferase subunit 2
MSYDLNYLKQLESEAVHIIREASAEFNNPVMLYSIGKDSSVLLHLAKKAFYPAKIPFKLLHIDTGFKFREMIEFRDKISAEMDGKLLVHKNEEPEALAMKATDANSETYIYYKKTRPLLEAIKKYNFDACFGGARRDEEKSRAKERIFSIRDDMGRWNPKNQRPELWHSYNGKLGDGENMRVFPLSNWTEVDIWTYIQQEKIEIVPLYFAKTRKVVKRGGCYLRLDEFVEAGDDEEVLEIMCRYRTLGCSPSTGAVESDAKTLDEIILEVLAARKSERETRMIDQGSESSMEKKKKEGYF